MQTILVTGGAGFIGSALVRQLLRETDVRVVTLDALTYAGNLESLGDAMSDRRHRFIHADVTDAPAVRALFAEHHPDAVVHLAAETHVDRSIDDPGAFIATNVVGTHVLLSEALRHWRALPAAAAAEFRLVHVSTDEVFGSLGPDGLFSETSPYDPSSPYAASKAGADHLARAWHRTYGLPVIITNCSNNYGPYQFPEKLIPLTIARAIAGRSMPVYGRGEQVRDWLHVEDHVRALRLVLQRAEPGASYNIGAHCARTNLEVVREICGLLDELRPASRPHAERIEFVPDRPGHDQRYAIDATRIRERLGWAPRESFASGLRGTVAWYLANPEWSDRVGRGAYRGERLGLGAMT